MNDQKFNAEVVDAIFCERDQLKAENSALRELVRMLANCAAGHGCDYCPINGGHGYVDEIDMCESVHDYMRELRVEVI